MSKLINHEKIVQLRKERQWGQTHLARVAGVDQSVVSRVERGIQEDVSLSVVVAIARVLGVSIDSLLIEGTTLSNQEWLVPELQAAINQLRNYPEQNQRQAAGILRGYISTLEVE